MAEKKSPHHDEFMKLHSFKEEYIEKLDALGVKSPHELAEALQDEDTVKIIHEHLKGVGPKTVEHWKEDLGVAAEVEEEEKEAAKPAAQKVRKVKAEAPAEAKKEKKPEKKEKKPEEKEEAKEKKKGAKKEGKEEEEVEIEEEGEYQVKLKPKLSKEMLAALSKRAEIDGRRPAFRRQEWHARRKLQKVNWRKPQGDHSKMRQHYGYRRNVVSIGFGGPKASRYLHPSGFREVMVRNLKDLERINPELEAARVAHQVGMKKRIEIEDKADELKIRILNRSV
jgi:large subunit ribosomal protein L32e